MAGEVSFQEMSRSDILRVVQDAASPKKLPLMTADDDHHEEARDAVRLPRKLKFTSRRGSRRVSDPRVLEFNKFIDVQRVHARDIRKLLNAFTVTNEPTIVVRKQAVLINADPVRAVVMRDRCLVILPDGADSLLRILIDNFREYAPAEQNDLPYELRAIEALLATICLYFESEFERTAPIVSTALDRLVRGRISMGQLETLRKFKNSINEFESQVDGIRRALMLTLDSENDIRLLHLTRLYEDPTLLNDLYSFDSEEAEALIENYLQEIFSTRTKASLLQYRIQNTESLVMIQLDSVRNYLLGVDLVFSLVAISISIGTYVTGAFGMNLDSHLQEEPGWFWGVVGTTLIASIVITVAGVHYFRKRGVFI
ncbi:hypothetical protein PINS_up001543 [Pythium insidiosum]|nr:hypothetical protein PINS_up001543 [Pythium insidiosum]